MTVRGTESKRNPEYGSANFMKQNNGNEKHLITNHLRLVRLNDLAKITTSLWKNVGLEPISQSVYSITYRAKQE